MKNLRHRFLYVLLYLLVALAFCACDTGSPTPTVPARPQPQPIATTTQVPGTPIPTSTPAPSNTPTDTPTITGTPTPTPTFTETPQATFITTPGPRPTTIVKQGPGINVARQQYEDALAKWRSHNILEYEIVVKYDSFAPFAGAWDLRVAGDKIDIVGYTDAGGAPATPAVPGDTLSFLTVDQQFAAIEHVINGGSFGPIQSQVDYVVTFDPAFGYPASVEIKPRPNAPPDVGSSTVVKSLNILKRKL